MPLMMDDDMDIDDLFGDGTALSLPSRPPPSTELIQRIDELRASGCCQYVRSKLPSRRDRLTGAGQLPGQNGGA